MKTNFTLSGFNKSKRMFQFKKLHLKDETSNFLKSNLKHSSKNIHNHKREKTFSNNINDDLTTLNFNNTYNTYKKRNLSYNFITSYREIKAIDKYSSPHYIIDPSIKRIITIPKYKQNYKNKSLTLVSKSVKNKLKKIQLVSSPNLSIYNNFSPRKNFSVWYQNSFKKNNIINKDNENKIVKNHYNFIPSYREIKAVDKYSSPRFIINPSVKRIITIPKSKQNYKNKSLTLVSKSVKNKLKKIQIVSSPNLSIYNNFSPRKNFSVWYQNSFKKNIIINKDNENKIAKNQYNFKNNQKFKKILSNRELKLLNNPDSIFYQIFNQVKSKVNKNNPIYQKPEDKLKEYYEDIKKNEEEAIKELYLLKLQFILSDQEKMIGKINSTNTFMDIKVKQLEG